MWLSNISLSSYVSEQRKSLAFVFEQFVIFEIIMNSIALSLSLSLSLILNRYI